MSSSKDRVVHKDILVNRDRARKIADQQSVTLDVNMDRLHILTTPSINEWWN